ncbi:glycosyltransferase family 4 protein [Halanaerobium congolense]|uniref:UDP-GlcNAc:undecaprenyl-phosphate GlcNAc-1-phosphate transferase n=1 Tax=Halanaerobium congolense TaxID=54121 RepID=A0A1G6J1G7_9FIRM|nr:MraY family glycosyltransferase [Halanaerobium congolense]PXV70067.1 UDP-GlcNAc:undecaprenyl-phosphate GlcNAc-1-phosphate transferase [Halanaerobium congolense]SDC12692.1 UDP-GlcNAc:undecaprenyl-phosphate GlcNAc-1-phosphate transferase [Halanaerobium congolense]SDI43834.1 UDP-GlcNAc:undecaprenyl-phosphate GlcNAc-1-phosphate transferase [Halanaerobium congolense]SDK57968.1 UDP-GlcNAc:undecaprenyl-phosphate GlcNAc-1-phosphate transferase [Halanaerobium congolense]SDM18787.1 UDP-GlcNAc:undecap
MLYLAAFLIALVLALGITPVVIKLANRFNFVDKPGKRKINKKIVATAGGTAIYLAFMIPLRFFIPLNQTIKGIIIGGSFMLVLGLLDDKLEISAPIKFGGQIIGALILIFYGVKINFITNPFGGFIYLGIYTIPFTVFWIVSIINTINLIDGLDGLAAGVSIIAVLTLFAVALQENQLVAPMLAVLLAGSCLGFLKYNFNPAEIFMGDTGSMFIGYIIAAVSITGALKSAAAVTIFVPMLALAVPILDTTFAIIRRVFNDRPIGEADHGHIHHRLLAIGMNQKQAVISVYIISAFLGTVAFIINGIKFDQALIIFIAVILTVIYGAKKIGIFSVELPQEGCSLEDN